MGLDIDGLDVQFPYAKIYPEQEEYMRALKQSVEGGKHAILEMPSCVGRTAAVLSLVTSYRLAHPDAVGKFFIATRTATEMEKVLEELRVLERHRDSLAAGATTPRLVATGLPSRRMLELAYRERAEAGDTAEAATGAATTEEEDHGELLCPGVNSVETVVAAAVRRQWGATRLAVHLTRLADVVVCDYCHVLDPKLSQLVLGHVHSSSTTTTTTASASASSATARDVLVFDEAHNIDNVCIDVLSVHARLPTLASSRAALERLSQEISQAASSPDDRRLDDEYRRLVCTPLSSLVLPRGASEAASAGALEWAVTELFGASPCSAAAGAEEADGVDGGDGGGDGGGGDGGASTSAGVGAQSCVPGNLRRAVSFVWYLHRFVDAVHRRLEECKAASFVNPHAFLHDLEKDEPDFSNALRHVGGRLRLLLTTLRPARLHDYAPLVLIADLATLLASHVDDGFDLHLTPHAAHANLQHRDPLLQLCCHDAAAALRPLLAGGRFRAVVLTAGTFAPIELYQKLLGLEDAIATSVAVRFPREAVRPLVVTRGSDQVAMRSGGGEPARDSPVSNYGKLLIECAAAVPDGLVCYFASMSQLQRVTREWSALGVLRDITSHKLVFIETCDVTETAQALANYKRACDAGRGAVLLAAARSRVAEGVSFDRHYGRAVVVLGFPFLDVGRADVVARLEWLHHRHGVSEADFLTFDAMRQTTQCAASALRGKSDYAVLLLADMRYAQPKRRARLPQWIRQFLSEERHNLSSDIAVALARQHMRLMAQGVPAGGSSGTAAAACSSWVRSTLEVGTAMEIG